jgi:transcriptional regulator with XRE-family HTH domain
VISRWETGAAKPQFDHILGLVGVLEVELERLMIGEGGDTTKGEFEIRNKRLKELCRQVDELGSEDQYVVCHLMDSLVRKERMKAALGETTLR